MTNTTVSPNRTRPGGFADQDAVYPQRLWAMLLEPLLLIICMAGDVVAFSSVMQMAATTLGNLTWYLAVAFAFASTALMFFAGSIWRKWVAGESDRGRLQATMLTLAWMVMGIAAFLIRWQGAPVDSGAQTLGDTPSQSSSDSALLGALVFVGLFLATGMLAWYSGYRSTNPRQRAWNAACKNRRHWEAKAGVTGQELQASVNLRAHHQEDLARVIRKRDEALAVRRSWAAELREYSRYLMAVHQSDPAGTVALTVPDSAVRVSTDPAGSVAAVRTRP